MPKRSINYYLIKLVRLSGWALLALMVVYFVTGFSLSDKLGMRRLLSTQAALVIHQSFDWPLLAVFLVHSSLTTYFALRRWRWIKRKSRSDR